MWFSKAAAALLVCALLSACGFEPLYARRADGSTVDHMAVTKIAVIEDRVGQQLRNVLLEELTPRGQPAQPLYVLEVKLTESISNLAIQKDDTTSRSSLELRATYVLRRIADGEALFDGLSRATTSYNVVSSNFATVSAENDARRRNARVLGEEMKIRLAAYFNRIRQTAVQ
jgi:LPS-assembly lipoprotein